MKKVFAFLAVSVIGCSAFAQNGIQGTGNYGMAGCGLGSMLFKENTKVNQILGATTNGTSGSQTFGISTGTSNCTAQGVARVEKEAEMFVEVNYDVLQKEISQGKGETLNSFATVLGCTDSKLLGKSLKANYPTISKSTDSNQFLTNVRTTISKDQTLSSTCKTVVATK